MNALKAVKVAELRKKLTIIPIKILIALALTGVLFWDGSFSVLVDGFVLEPKKHFIMLALVYGAVSYVVMFIQLFHSLVLGIIAAIAALVFVIIKLGNVGTSFMYSITHFSETLTRPLLIALAIMLFGGPLLDIIRILRYNSLKKSVIRAEEERLAASYDSGYGDGYQRGFSEGNQSAFRKVIEQDEAEEEWLMERHRRMHRRNARLEEEYQDDFEQGYIEDDGYEQQGYIEAEGGQYYEDDGYYEGDQYYEGEEDYEDSEPVSDKSSASNKNRQTQSFFADCKTDAAIKRRYHDLCKVYHPDSGNGSAEIFYAVQAEYESLMK